MIGRAAKLAALFLCYGVAFVSCEYKIFPIFVTQFETYPNIMKKALAIFFLLALTSLSILAQIPNGYYNNANGKTGDELKIALHNIIKGHPVVSYG